MQKQGYSWDVILHIGKKGIEVVNIAILIPELGGGGAEHIAQIVGDYYYEKGEHVYYFLGDTSVKQIFYVKGEIINTGIKSCTEGTMYGDIQVLERLLQNSRIMRRWKRKYYIDVAISFMEEFNYLNILSKGTETVLTRICTVLSQRNDLKGILYNKFLVRFLYSRSDKVIVMSEYAKEDMCKNYGIPNRKLQKIPNPVLPYEEGISEDEWRYGDSAVICVGRLEHVKQQERIIRAFSYVKAYHEEAQLLILGTGPNKKYLERICHKWKLKDSVSFLGFTDNVNFYLKHSKVFVMASKTEGFPNSMLEAMVQGVPVVTTDSPGACREIIGKRKSIGKKIKIQYCDYGILTPRIPSSIRRENELIKEEILLGKAIEMVLSNQEIYKEYSVKSRKRAAMYDRERIMKIWDTMIGKSNSKIFL